VGGLGLKAEHRTEVGEGWKHDKERRLPMGIAGETSEDCTGGRKMGLNGGETHRNMQGLDHADWTGLGRHKARLESAD